MKRKASAVWKGGLKDGKGTNPEELIAAAHAGCFSMALSGQLGAAGMTAERIDTTASVTLEKLDTGSANATITMDATLEG